MVQGRQILWSLKILLMSNPTLPYPKLRSLCKARGPENFGQLAPDVGGRFQNHIRVVAAILPRPTPVAATPPID